MSSDPWQLRGQAGALRHGADQITMLRLRLAHTILDTTHSSHGGARRAGAEVHSRWVSHEDAELGRIAAALRARATLLDATAIAGERTSGRRLGGYTGAGFLGRGVDAHRRVAAVARSLRSPGTGAAHGARIQGLPMAPTAGDRAPEHPPRTAGIETPAYEDDGEATAIPSGRPTGPPGSRGSAGPTGSAAVSSSDRAPPAGRRPPRC